MGSPNDAFPISEKCLPAMSLEIGAYRNAASVNENLNYICTVYFGIVHMYTFLF